MNAPEPAHVLLQHQTFLRALARRLVMPDEADDLAQDAWVRALERPPRTTENLRGWLRKVTRNLASNRHRKAGGRADGEQRAARAEEVDAADVDVAQAELQRAVLDAVLALDEPYRATILARTFRGQSAREIATETGVPIATVRSREQRALARLREHLDRRSGGDRAAWVGGLACLIASGEPVPAGVGALAGGAVAALAVALAGVLIWRGVETEPEAPRRLAAAAPLKEAPRAAVPSTERRAPAELTTASVAALPAATPPAVLVAEDACEVRGRFVLPGGAPAIGLEVRVEGWVCQPHRAVELDPPEDWVDPVTTTDAEGRFAFTFVPTPAFCYRLKAARPGFAAEDWMWLSLAPGEVKDLGDVALRPGGTIEGRILLPDGQPALVDGLEVHADGLAFLNQASPFGRRGAWKYGPVDPVTGRYRVEDLPAGPIQLKVGDRYGRLGPWTEPVPTTIAAGDVTFLDLPWSPPVESRDIVVEVETSRFTTAVPALESVHLRKAGEAPRVPDSGTFGRYVFADLPQGPFTVEIDDPGFGFWSQGGVEPGEVVEVLLEGSATLCLDVRDEADHPVESFRVDSHWHQSPAWPDRFLLHDGSTPLPAGRLAGIVPGDHTLTVRVGDRTRTVEVAGLQPGESRTVALTMTGTANLTGTVRDATGRPVAGAQVLLLRPAATDDGPTCRVLRSEWASHETRVRVELARNLTDETGTFRFELQEPGAFALLASRGTNLEVATASFVVAAGESATRDLVLPSGATIRGTLRSDPQGGWRGCQVLAFPRERSLRIGEGRLSVTPSASGDFAFEPLTPGQVDLFVVLPGWIASRLHRSDQDLLGGRWLGSVSLTDGEETRADFDVTGLVPGVIRVQVLGAQGPLPAATVRIHQDPFEASAGPTTVADANGLVEFRAFPGVYHVAAIDAGEAPLGEALEVSLAPGGVTNRTLLLGR